jgi:hypothetical protein
VALKAQASGAARHRRSWPAQLWVSAGLIYETLKLQWSIDEANREIKYLAKATDREVGNLKDHIEREFKYLTRGTEREFEALSAQAERNYEYLSGKLERGSACLHERIKTESDHLSRQMEREIHCLSERVDLALAGIRELMKTRGGSAGEA